VRPDSASIKPGIGATFPNRYKAAGLSLGASSPSCRLSFGRRLVLFGKRFTHLVNISTKLIRNIAKLLPMLLAEPIVCAVMARPNTNV